MPKLDEAKDLALSYLDEIDGVIGIRQSYNEIVVGYSGHLFSALGSDKAGKAALQQALRHKAVDPSALYKPLIVQINGIFENYVRSLVVAVVKERYENVQPYSSLSKAFRHEHVVHAAKIIEHLKSGTVMGMPYNFDELLSNVGKALTDQAGYKLHPEVFTQLMGNCTSERLERLFLALSLPEPFSDQLGRNPMLKGYFSDQTKGRVSQRAREELDGQIRLRNLIVHGDLTRSVDLVELQNSLSFFRALISSLDGLAQPQTAATD